MSNITTIRPSSTSTHALRNTATLASSITANRNTSYPAPRNTSTQVHSTSTQAPRNIQIPRTSAQQQDTESFLEKSRRFVERSQQIYEKAKDNFTNVDSLLLCTIARLKSNAELYQEVVNFPTFTLEFTPEQIGAFKYNRLASTGVDNAHKFNQSIYRLLSIVKSLIENVDYTDKLQMLQSLMQNLYGNDPIQMVLCNQKRIIQVMQPFTDLFITHTWIKQAPEITARPLLIPYFKAQEPTTVPLLPLPKNKNGTSLSSASTILNSSGSNFINHFNSRTVPAECMSFGLPFEPNRVKIAMSNILKIPISFLHTPSSANSEYATLDTVLWALFFADDITPKLLVQNKILNYQLMSLPELSGQIIANKNRDAAKVFLDKMNRRTSSQQETRLQPIISQIVKTIEDSDSSDLKQLNDQVLSLVAKMLQVPTDTSCLECKRKGVLSEEKLVRCTSLLNRNVIFTVLLAYPDFEYGVPLQSLKICPIQVRTVLSIFNYYKFRKINIENGFIQLSTASAAITSVKKMMEEQNYFQQSFENLVASVNLKASFMEFVNTILSLSSLPVTFLLNVMENAYNLNGLKTTLIAATLVQFTLGINTNAHFMYELIKKLSPLDIAEINKKLGMSDNVLKKFDVDELYIDPGWLIAVDTKYIHDTIVQLEKQPKIIDKISFLSQNIYSAYSIMVYWLDTRQQDQRIKTSIYLLLLFSTIPERLKTIVYQKLSEPTVKLKELTYNKPSDRFAFTTHSAATRPYDFYYSLLANNIDFVSDIQDISTFVRVKKDYPLYTIAQENETRY